MLITINGALHSCRIVKHCKAPFLFMDLLFIKLQSDNNGL